MTTPTGQISITDIRNEFYGGGGPPDLANLGQQLLARPIGQKVSMSEFRGRTCIRYTLPSTYQIAQISGQCAGMHGGFTNGFGGWSGYNLYDANGWWVWRTDGLLALSASQPVGGNPALVRFQILSGPGAGNVYQSSSFSRDQAVWPNWLFINGLAGPPQFAGMQIAMQVIF